MFSFRVSVPVLYFVLVLFFARSRFVCVPCSFIPDALESIFVPTLFVRLGNISLDGCFCMHSLLVVIHGWCDLPGLCLAIVQRRLR